jgi:hypothetical protein
MHKLFYSIFILIIRSFFIFILYYMIFSYFPNILAFIYGFSFCAQFFNNFYFKLWLSFFCYIYTLFTVSKFRKMINLVIINFNNVIVPLQIKIKIYIYIIFARIKIFNIDYFEIVLLIFLFFSFNICKYLIYVY